MKKKILTSIVLSGLLAFPLIGLAVVAEVPPGIAPTAVTSGAELIALIQTIGNWIFIALLAVAAIFLIYAGFMWVTAGGDPNAAIKARTMLINALIGVAVALLAKGMVQVIKSIIGTGTGT